MTVLTVVTSQSISFYKRFFGSVYLYRRAASEQSLADGECSAAAAAQRQRCKDATPIWKQEACALERKSWNTRGKGHKMQLPTARHDEPSVRSESKDCGFKTQNISCKIYTCKFNTIAFFSGDGQDIESSTRLRVPSRSGTSWFWPHALRNASWIHSGRFPSRGGLLTKQSGGNIDSDRYNMRLPYRNRRGVYKDDRCLTSVGHGLRVACGFVN